MSAIATPIPAGTRALASGAHILALVGSLPSWVVAILATWLGNWGLLVYTPSSAVLMPGDGAARLNIARRVVDSLDPSFVQLGGVWLPLPQILMLPTIWHDTFWRTGLAGAGVSVLAFGLGTAYVHATVRVITREGWVALLAAAVFATNPNLLYLQSTPMAETLMIALLMGTTFHLIRLAQGATLGHLFVAGLFTVAASLTRYEAWVLVPAGAVVVGAIAWERFRAEKKERGKSGLGGGARQIEGLILAWLVLATYGIALWILYNGVIFGDALNFARGAGTAAANAASKAQDGQLHTKGNVVTSVVTYGWATLDNAGLPLAQAAAFGALCLAASRRLTVAVKAAILLPCSIFAFEVTALTFGQAVLWTAHDRPFTMFNVRYGLLMLPALTIAAGCLALPSRRAGMILLALVLAPQLVQLPTTPRAADAVATLVQPFDPSNEGESRALAERWVGANRLVLSATLPATLTETMIWYRHEGEAAQEAAAWLRQNAATGKVLVSTVSNDHLVFHAGLPLSRYVSEGTQPFFSQEMEQPGMHTDWIVYRPLRGTDMVGPLFKGGGAPRSFERVFSNEHFEIYARRVTARQT